MTDAMAASVTAASAGVKPSVGIPVPVPDAEVSPEQTIATQQEMSAQTAPIDQGPGGGNVEKEIKIDEDEAPPADYVPYEKAPEAVKQVQPKYPDLATRAGLEGTVWVKIWVDKEGKPKKAVVQKSDAEIFNQPATEAAMQWIFTPAMMKNGPVSVWVSIPFRFKLQGK
jgi:protein TonB